MRRPFFLKASSRFSLPPLTRGLASSPPSNTSTTTPSSSSSSNSSSSSSSSGGKPLISFWSAYVRGLNPRYLPRQRAYEALTLSGVSAESLSRSEFQQVTLCHKTAAAAELDVPIRPQRAAKSPLGRHSMVVGLHGHLLRNAHSRRKTGVKYNRQLQHQGGAGAATPLLLLLLLLLLSP
ncbi:hypothetical protein Emed_003896 [Eimeria media]